LRAARYHRRGGWPAFDKTSTPLRPCQPTRNHRGVMHVIQLSEHRAVEIPHQGALLQRVEVLVHQSAQDGPKRGNSHSVTTHVGESHARNDTGRTNRDVMHVTTRLTGTRWNAVYPGIKTWQLQQCCRPAGARPHVPAPKAFRPNIG
jgi:hypothetical protein